MSSVTKKSVKPESLLNTEVSVSVSDRNKKNITTHTHTHTQKKSLKKVNGIRKQPKRPTKDNDLKIK